MQLNSLRAIALLAGLLSLLVAGCGHPQALYEEPPRSALEQGQQAEQRRQYDEADRQYARIDNLTVRYMTLNHLHSAWNSVNANIVYAQQMVAERPESADAHLRLAEHYYQKGVLGTRYSRENLGTYPRDFLRGEQEYYYNTAIEHVNRALRLQPHMPEAYLVLGEIYLANGLSSKALMELKRAIAYNPEFARGYYAIGKVYVEQGKYALSERYFIKAIKLDSTLYDAYYLLGDVFLELELTEYAARTFLEVLRHHPQDGPAFERLIASCHALAKEYVEQGRYADAISLTQAVLKVRSDYDVHQTFLLARAKQQEEALLQEQQAAMESMTEEESDVDTTQFVERAFADQSLEALIPMLEANDDVEFAEALQYVEDGNYEQAQDILYSASVAQNRENPYRLLTLAFTQKHLGRTDEAVQTLETVTSAKDMDSRAQLIAWLALRTLGQQLDQNSIYRVLGVVIQVKRPDQPGVEMTAAYLDGRVRHLTGDGDILIWDRADGEIADMARNVVYAANAIARDFPSEQQRDAFRDGAVRISLLTVGGIRVLEDTADRIQNSLMFPVFESGTALLDRLLAIYNAA